MIVLHPRIRWVQLEQQPNGSVVCSCRVCGQQTQATQTAHVEMFANQHSAHRSSPAHYGAGDVVAGITKSFGAKPCAPCEQRRHKLNQLFPRVFRR